MREFRCQHCGDTSAAPANCVRCELPMIAEDQSEVVRIAARSLRNKLLGWYFIAWLLLHVAANVYINLRYRRDDFLLHVAAILGSIALTLALAATARVMNRAGNTSAAKRVERWPADRPVTSMAAAAEGKVAIRGRVRAGTVVFGVGDRRAVATTNIRHEGRLAPSLISRAAEFTVEDEETHERATVRASEVIIVGGLESEGEQFVPDGARVEIAGLGARRIVSDREGGYRSDVRALELSGTAADPIVIRVLESTDAVADAEASFGLRVDVSEQEAAGGDEVEVAPGESKSVARSGARGT